jgi:tRNA-specific 2-thiouridylase
MSKKGRVLMAMSGGIDSSLAAVMLHEQGYEVIGMTMKTWDYASSGATKKETGCCSLDSINDARSIAVSLGFPHYILDIREEFGDYVINHFTNEYLDGRTPNPCVLCNTHIKWDALLRRADKLGCEWIATGHYAKVKQENDRYFISKGFDSTNKSESYEICFVPDNDYRGFLKRRVEGLEEKVRGGEFVLEDGTVVGHHEGYPFYTIGQRKGLGITLGYPVFVTEIQKESNRVVLGEIEGLSRDAMWVDQLHMQKYESLSSLKKDTVTKIRYNDDGSPALVEQIGDEMRVLFKEKVKAIAPGQAAVFYEGNDVIGGGWIKSSFNQANDEKIY